MSKILFIEGVSGVGKSTSTIKIADILSQNGFSVKCFVESDYENPIDFYCTAYFNQDEYANLTKNYSAYIDDIIENTVVIEDIRLIRYYNQNVVLFPEPLLTKLKENEFCYKPKKLVSLSEYSRVYKLVWELFAKTIDSEVDFYIFDGSLFHHPINDLIHNYNANELQILSHINTLVSSISSCYSVVYYLKTNNVSTQLNKARRSRNQSILSDSELLFWETRKKTDLKVLKQIEILIRPESFEQNCSKFLVLSFFISHKH